MFVSFVRLKNLVLMATSHCYAHFFQRVWKYTNRNFQDGYQLCFVNCDWNIFCSIQNYIKPTSDRLNCKLFHAVCIPI